jgi:hypothetical protein
VRSVLLVAVSLLMTGLAAGCFNPAGQVFGDPKPGPQLTVVKPVSMVAGEAATWTFTWDNGYPPFDVTADLYEAELDAESGTYGNVVGGQLFEWAGTSSSSTLDGSFTIPVAGTYAGTIRIEDSHYVPPSGGFPFPVPYNGADEEFIVITVLPAN